MLEEISEAWFFFYPNLADILHSQKQDKQRGKRQVDVHLDSASLPNFISRTHGILRREPSGVVSLRDNETQNGPPLRTSRCPLCTVQTLGNFLISEAGTRE